MHDCVGVLLAGGAARRFGGAPKGLASVAGGRIADHALSALRGATTSQIVVANDPRAAEWFPGVRIVADEQQGLGPLGGIVSALAAARTGVVVLAWDMPFVPAELLRELARRGTAGDRAVVPTHGAPAQREPLCAFYPSRALAAGRDLLARAERRAGALADAVPMTELLHDDDLSAFGDPAVMFTSVDTPEQLAAVGGALP